MTQTIEMPTITAGLSPAVAASAEATQQVALDLETQANEDAAAETAAKKAKKAKAEAVRKAEAEKKAEAAAKARAEAAEEAAERASRTAERTTLSASSGSSASSSAPSSYSSSSATGSAASIVAFAKAQVGDAYVPGGTGPNSWDCSGLVQAAYASVGIDLPRVSQSQSTFGTQVSLDNLQPGDILYWGSAGSAYHVAIYVGGGQFVGAQNSSTGTVQRSLDYDMPTGAVRVL